MKLERKNVVATMANGSNHVCIIPFTDKVMQDRKNNYNIANESMCALSYNINTHAQSCMCMLEV